MPISPPVAPASLTGQHWCEAPVAAREHRHYAVELSPSLPLSCHAAAGPRRTQPRSTAQWTATVCEAQCCPVKRRVAMRIITGSRHLELRVSVIDLAEG